MVKQTMCFSLLDISIVWENKLGSEFISFVPCLKMESMPKLDIVTQLNGLNDQ